MENCGIGEGQRTLSERVGVEFMGDCCILKCFKKWNAINKKVCPFPLPCFPWVCSQSLLQAEKIVAMLLGHTEGSVKNGSQFLPLMRTAVVTILSTLAPSAVLF